MYCVKKETDNQKLQRKHAGNSDHDNPSVSIQRKPSGFAAPFYSLEHGLQNSPTLIQRQPDKNIIQFTKLVTSPNGDSQTVSVFPKMSNVVLGDGDGERCAVFTRARLKTKHVMLILEWHDGHNTGNIVEHMARESGKAFATIERKEPFSEKFNLNLLAGSETANFEHKILTLRDKNRAITLLNAENGKSYWYYYGGTDDNVDGAEDNPYTYNCITWADKIWNKITARSKKSINKEESISR